LALPWLAAADEERRLRGYVRSAAICSTPPSLCITAGKRTGDGVLIEFRSVVDAVRCAIDVQSGMVERNAGLSVGRDEKMLVDGKTVPYAWDLVLDADSQPRDPVRRLARDIAAVEQDGARCRRQLSAEHLEERALAGAVGAEPTSATNLFPRVIPV